MESINSWSKRAACVGTTDFEIFFQADSESNLKRKKLCTDCPVKDLCRAYAVAHDEYGFWGNTSKYQRDRLGAIFRRLIRDQFFVAGLLEYRPSLEDYLKQKGVQLQVEKVPNVVQQAESDPILDPSFEEFEQYILQSSA